MRATQKSFDTASFAPQHSDGPIDHVEAPADHVEAPAEHADAAINCNSDRFSADAQSDGLVESKRQRVVEIQSRLCPVYQCPIEYFHSLDPLSELVSSMLNHRTRNAEASKARRALIAKFGSWENVRDADPEDIEPAIAMVRWPEMKARSIPAALQEVTRRVGSLNLDFLADMPPEEARQWLEEIRGVGPKTSAAVLSFSSIRGRALPVDSHHHRVAQRIGLIGAKVSPAASHPLLESYLPEDWDAQDVYDHHEVMMLHGQRVCLHSKPRCQQCPLTDLCDHYQNNVAGNQVAGNQVAGNNRANDIDVTEANASDVDRSKPNKPR